MKQRCPCQAGSFGHIPSNFLSSFEEPNSVLLLPCLVKNRTEVIRSEDISMTMISFPPLALLYECQRWDCPKTSNNLNKCTLESDPPLCTNSLSLLQERQGALGHTLHPSTRRTASPAVPQHKSSSWPVDGYKLRKAVFASRGFLPSEKKIVLVTLKIFAGLQRQFITSTGGKNSP